MDELRDLYEEMILEHNRNPRNFPKKPEGANCQGYGFNPLCGDEFTVYLTVEDGIVKDAGFEGAGCAISTASASMMTEQLKGKTVAEVEALFSAMHDMLTHDHPNAEAQARLGKLGVLSGVKEYPMRVKCATLAWHTMTAALQGRQGTVCTEAPPEEHLCGLGPQRHTIS
jgi:nitrogen fixation NifU-like protein